MWTDVCGQMYLYTRVDTYAHYQDIQVHYQDIQAHYQLIYNKQHTSSIALLKLPPLSVGSCEIMGAIFSAASTVRHGRK